MVKKRGGRQSTLPFPFMVDTKPADSPEADGDVATNVDAQVEQNSCPQPEVNPLIVEYHRAFYDQRKDFLASERESAKAFDKTMTVLAAGAFGLSITFVKELTPSPVRGSLPFFYCSWSLLGLSLLSIMCSHLSSLFGWRRAMANEDEAFKNGGIPPEGRNRWIRITHSFNFLSLALFAGGILFFAVFAVRNL